MGIMVQVQSVIKDGDGNIIAVRGKEMIPNTETPEQTWTAKWICNRKEPNTNFFYSTHAFYVRDLSDENNDGESVIHGIEKNGKLCLVAPSEHGNLLEKLPVYSE